MDHHPDFHLSTLLQPQHALKVPATLLLLAIFYYILTTTSLALFSPLSIIPGPRIRAWSKIPMLHALFTGAEGSSYRDLHATYGPVVRISPTQVSFATGAEGFQQIYGFRKAGQGGKFGKDRQFYGKPINGVHSVISADDVNHSRQRKILSNAFSDKALKEQEPLLKRWTEKMRDKMAETAKGGGKVDMLKLYNCTTFDIMADLSFAEGLNMLEDGDYSPWVKTIFAGIKFGTWIRAAKLLSPLTHWLMEEKLMKSERVRAKQMEHWRYSSERVDRRLAREPDRPDLWTRILEKSRGMEEGKGGGGGGEGMSLQEHYSNASVFMIAGTETTATALSGVTYHLLQNPATMEKLKEEIRTAFSSFEDLRLEKLAQQKYLMAVLTEGLRIYPPVPIALPRVVPAGGAVVGGYELPAGTVVGVHHLAQYQSEEHFRKPGEFHPERWLGDGENGGFEGDHLDALEPFSVGPRNCLGKNLAWHEMRLLLATTILHFDIELCEESDQWADQKVYILWEKKPLICRLKPVKEW